MRRPILSFKTRPQFNGISVARLAVTGASEYSDGGNAPNQHFAKPHGNPPPWEKNLLLTHVILEQIARGSGEG